MQQIALTVIDDQKAKSLLEILDSLDFVQDVQIQPTEVAEDEMRFHQHPRQAEMVKEVAAFEAMHSELVHQYLGQFVAVHHGQVIDHDRDEMTLVDRIYQQYPDEIIMIDQVQEYLPPPIKIRWRKLV